MLDRTASHGWAQSELEEKLRGIEDRRMASTEMARTEISRASALASVEAINGIETSKDADRDDETGKPCSFCATLIDKWVAVDEPILSLNEAIIGRDGGIFINNLRRMAADVPRTGATEVPRRQSISNAERRSSMMRWLIWYPVAALPEH